jgi:hypothetical protein
VLIIILEDWISEIIEFHFATYNYIYYIRRMICVRAAIMYMIYM